MRLANFDYDLPEELIAQHPLERRDASRMLVVNRETQSYSDSQFELLPQYVRPGDLLVVNNTRVFPARLIGEREPTGGRVEVLLVRELEDAHWEALVKPGHRLKPGARINFGDSRLRAEVVETRGAGQKVIKFESEQSIQLLIDERGQTPLPPYIRRPDGTSDEDSERYQTVFARERGAIAAPTAGLHFTPNAIEAIRAAGAQVVEITLHVGYGTFEPVRVDDIEQHHVSPEFFRITEEAANIINDTRSKGGRVIAVGTTTTRALESAVNSGGEIEAGAGQTALTITPGFRFRVADALLTNFHLPQSSLLLLVSAFAGRELTLEAYRHAVAARYRFYSYGDCMLVI